MFVGDRSIASTTLAGTAAVCGPDVSDSLDNTYVQLEQQKRLKPALWAKK